MSRSQVLKVQEHIKDMLRAKKGLDDLVGGYRKRKPGRPKGSRTKTRRSRGGALTATPSAFGARRRHTRGGSLLAIPAPFGGRIGGGIREQNKMLNQDLNHQASMNGIPAGHERTVYKIHAVQQLAKSGKISQQRAHDLLTKYQVGSENIQYARQALGMGRRRYRY